MLRKGWIFSSIEMKIKKYLLKITLSYCIKHNESKGGARKPQDFKMYHMLNNLKSKPTL